MHYIRSTGIYIKTKIQKIRYENSLPTTAFVHWEKACSYINFIICLKINDLSYSFKHKLHTLQM